jgi:hypothetical protein
VAKTSGITSQITIAGNDISNDIRSFNFDTPYGQQVVTGIDKAAEERLSLRADCTGVINGTFNASANKSHATLKTPGSKTFVIALASAAATLTFTANTTNYAVTEGDDGSLVWSANFALNSGTAAAWT